MNHPVISATSLDLHHDPVEDRLVLTARGAEDDPVAMTFTRRLTRALLGKLTDLLMRSNEEVGRAPAEHRAEVLLFEHMSALSEASRADASPDGGEATAGPKAPPPGTPVMVHRIDFTIRTAGIGIVLFDEASQRVSVGLTRAEAHRVLDMLVRKTREADWNLDEMDWLDRRRHIVVPDRVALS